jgi:phosphatidate cytidylyltransferase
MKSRLITAGLGIPLLIFAACVGNLLPLRLVLIGVASIAAVEFSRIQRAGSSNSWIWIGFAGFVAATVIWHPARAATPLILAVIAVPAIEWLSKKSGEGADSVPAPLLFGGWVLLPLLSAISLRAVSLPEPQDWKLHFDGNLLFLVFGCLWAGDSLAYFVGKSFGRHKMAATVSPNKTWEGAVANLISSAIVGWALGNAIDLPGELGLTIGAACGVVGQIGDLFQSRWKRLANIKDSGTLLPGHGGVLDRFDSLLFCLPAANAIASLWGM